MTTATNTPNDALRKAAVLVRSLDSDAVAALLTRMSPAEAKAIRLAVRELNEVSAAEQRSVADELRNAAVSNVPSGGVEVSFDSSAPPPGPEPITTPPASRLGQLSEAAPETLGACLAVEQPATVAVVLSCLAPRQAAEVLDRLPPTLQTQAIDRLADLGDIDPDSLSVIATELEAWIANHTQDQRRREDRRAMLQAILDASPSESRKRLAEQMSRHVPEIQPQEEAAQPQAVVVPQPAPEVMEAVAPPSPAPPKPQASFSSLESLPVVALARVLSHVDRQTLILSLVGASDALMTRLRQTANRKQIKLLERSIAKIGPVQLQDIEQAQQRVADTAAAVLLQPNGAR